MSANGLACTNAGQSSLVNMTRLGIPASYIAETTHSGGASGTTVMPMPISQGFVISAAIEGRTIVIKFVQQQERESTSCFCDNEIIS